MTPYSWTTKPSRSVVRLCRLQRDAVGGSTGMHRRSGGGLLFAAGTAIGAAAIGSIGSRRAPEVYARLDKPAWAPPAGVFGPAWTALYAAIGVAGWRLWTRDAGRTALGLHAAQLALNAAWPFTFFTARNHDAALITIAALDLHRSRDRARGAPGPAGSVAPRPVSGMESVRHRADRGGESRRGHRHRDVTFAVDQLPLLDASVEAKICQASKLFATSDSVM
jgi:translocator protein